MCSISHLNFLSWEALYPFYQLFIYYHSLEFIYTSKFILNIKNNYWCWFLQHEFPNFQVDVYVLVLQNDGSALAAAINCAGLALADASVPMYDLVSAASLVSGVYLS